MSDVSIAALSQCRPLFSYLLSLFPLLPNAFGGRELAFPEAESHHQRTIFHQSLPRISFSEQLTLRGGLEEGRGSNLLSLSILQKERSSPCLPQLFSK